MKSCTGPSEIASSDLENQEITMLALHLPNSYAALAGERVLNRLRSLARLIGREPVMLMG